MMEPSNGGVSNAGPQPIVASAWRGPPGPLVVFGSFFGSFLCGDLVEFDYSFSSYGHIGFLDSLFIIPFTTRLVSSFLPFYFLSF